jgi:elongator complex protein 3
VRRCFDAMNGFEAGSLEQAHSANENATHRNVGLVIETRPDHVNQREIERLRRLGVTKVQMGVQSLDDEILEMNKRGHTVQETHRAVALLRAAGFKIVLHWMPNLLGATPASDREDFIACGRTFALMRSRSIPTSSWKALSFTITGCAASTGLIRPRS